MAVSERLTVVEFGPSRSKRFKKAVAEAERGAGECASSSRAATGCASSSVRIPAAYTGLGRLLAYVRHWRATDVYQDDELVSTFHAKDIEVSGCPKSSRCSVAA